MKQEWKQILDHTVSFAYEYPLKTEADAIVSEVVEWMNENVGPMKDRGWVGLLVINPSSSGLKLVKALGNPWYSQRENPIMFTVCIMKEEDAMLFKLRWC